MDDSSFVPTHFCRYSPPKNSNIPLQLAPDSRTSNFTCLVANSRVLSRDYWILVALATALNKSRTIMEALPSNDHLC